jgi:hypothetical protein
VGVHRDRREPREAQNGQPAVNGDPGNNAFKKLLKWWNGGNLLTLDEIRRAFMNVVAHEGPALNQDQMLDLMT